MYDLCYLFNLSSDIATFVLLFWDCETCWRSWVFGPSQVLHHIANHLRCHTKAIFILKNIELGSKHVIYNISISLIIKITEKGEFDLEMHWVKEEALPTRRIHLSPFTSFRLFLNLFDEWFEGKIVLLESKQCVETCCISDQSSCLLKCLSGVRMVRLLHLVRLVRKWKQIKYH